MGKRGEVKGKEGGGGDKKGCWYSSIYNQLHISRLANIKRRLRTSKKSSVPPSPYAIDQLEVNFSLHFSPSI